MKLNIPEELKINPRYVKFNRDAAIKDVFDALVELITNSDDSYHRLYKKQLRALDGGTILIETCGGRKNQSVLIVRDKAEGMTLEVMRQKLAQIGCKSSESGDRGFMARGAKDCTALGDVTFESIVDDKYYKAAVTQGLKFIPQENGKSVNQTLRKTLSIDRGNGTVVTITLTQQKRMPQPTKICENLPLHYALRDILDEKSPTEILFRHLNTQEKPKKLTYYKPQGDIVVKEEYLVPGYANIKATLLIFKAPEPLEDISDNFRKSGLIIKGKRGIHECSLLQPSFEKDDLAKKFSGRIECEYIDFLLEDYDERMESGKPPTIENPCLIIDPNRQNGVERNHPFAKALLENPTQKLKELIDKERAESKKSTENIVGEDLKKKLDKLAKAASKYLSQQIEDLDSGVTEDEVDEEAFAKKGVLIYPTYANIALGNVRTFGVYVDRKIFSKEAADITLKSDSLAIEFLSHIIKLVPHKTKKNLLYGRFSIKGISLKDGICVETKCEGLPKAEALINVIENKIEEHQFVSPLEFEHKQYNIKEGSSKTISLFAKYPEFVNKETEIKVISNDNVSLPIKGKCVLVPVHGSNFARADITVEARRLCHEPITLLAELNDIKANTKIKISQQEEHGIPLKIEIKDEDFGNYRARWGDREGKPYLLLISSRHPSLKRYLGPGPNFEGQHSTHFRAILAEIVAECVCRKSLFTEAQHQSWLFHWADQKEDYLIAETVVAELHKRMKDFLPIAHQVMLEDKEVKIQS